MFYLLLLCRFCFQPLWKSHAGFVLYLTWMIVWLCFFLLKNKTKQLFPKLRHNWSDTAMQWCVHIQLYIFEPESETEEEWVTRQRQWHFIGKFTKQLPWSHLIHLLCSMLCVTFILYSVILIFCLMFRLLFCNHYYDIQSLNSNKDVIIFLDHRVSLQFSIQGLFKNYYVSSWKMSRKINLAD